MSTEQTRYWCHVCNREVPIYMAPEPTCQHCNEQFIEELHSDDDPREFLAGAETYNQNNENPQESTDGAPLQTGGTTLFSFGPRPREQDSGELGDEVFQFFTPRSATGNDENRTTGEGGPAPLVNMLQNMLTNIIGDNIEGRGDSNQPMLFYGDYVDGNFRFRSANSQNAPQNTTETTSQGASANENQQDSNENGGNEGEEPTGGARINGVNSILQYLAAMTSGSFDGGLVGNPNDYVFSQTALDNIITQLMEQTSGASAPAPASDQVIESLRKRGLTDEEKKQETDCAVCKDAFGPEETVLELPCEHIFHDDCIKPWLKLNGTCPVCRHSVSPEKKEEEDVADNENIENTENTNTSTDTNQSNTPLNRNNTATATFTVINGQPVQGTPGSWPVDIASLLQSVGSTQLEPSSTSNNDQRSSSHNEQHDNHSEQTSSDTASQQKPSTSNSSNSNTNNDQDEDRIYMDLD